MYNIIKKVSGGELIQKNNHLPHTYLQISAFLSLIFNLFCFVKSAVNIQKSRTYAFVCKLQEVKENYYV